MASGNRAVIRSTEPTARPLAAVRRATEYRWVSRWRWPRASVGSWRWPGWRPVSPRCFASRC